MAVFITVTTDAFAEVFAAASNTTSANPYTRSANIRRPLRGISVKEDTYSVIRVKTASGVSIPLFDSSARPSTGETTGMSDNYANFLIQRISEERVEKQQIVETFGEDYIYFFGERPRFLSITGALLNTADFNWKSEFWTNYEQHLRGTKLVEQNARMYLYFDDVVVEGYLVSAAATLSSDSPYMLPMQMQMFVSNYAILSNVGSVFFQNGPGQVALPPPTAEAAAAAVSAATRIGATGGLMGFLAASSSFVNNATFSIQQTLENIQNTLFNRGLVWPDGLGSAVAQASIANRAQFAPAPTNKPIHTMRDEYLGGELTSPKYDTAELARVNAELALRSPEALELKARGILAEMGVDTSAPGPTTLLLGRGAFAATQYAAPFGIRQASGVLSGNNPPTGITLI